MSRPGSQPVRSSVEAETEQRRLVWLIHEKPHSSLPQLCETHEPHFFFSQRENSERLRELMQASQGQCGSEDSGLVMSCSEVCLSHGVLRRRNEEARFLS